MRTITILLGLLALVSQQALGQSSLGPAATPSAQAIPDARDIPFPGVIKVAVDATNPGQAIFRVRETIPVAAAGPLTLLYPQWIPGDHRPSGPIDKLAGLVVTANGELLQWRRDPVEVHAFHLDLPAGVSAIDVEFQYVSPTAKDQGNIESNSDMFALPWARVSLYPAGYYVRQIPVEASVQLPADWRVATALDVAETRDAMTVFKTVSYEVLVDSPMLAGRHFRQIDLDPGGRSPVRLNMVGDTPADLEIKPEKIAALRKLVREADRLFGSRHFDHYDFLMWISDRLGGKGMEHHRSSENGVDGGYFDSVEELDLLPHEYVHSWNGKFRRGADLWTPDFRTPMRNSLLWVYEGQTQYWGWVLAARAGLLSKQQALDALAQDAAIVAARAGRDWRPLSDTTYGPITNQRRPVAWRNWQRGEDYYDEGQLIWLDVDTLLRERTDGKKSLDDFARAFFGTDDGVSIAKTYVFDDVVAALNAIVPHDWTTFLKSRLEGRGAAPLDGLARAGYRLAYRDKPTEFQRALEAHTKRSEFIFSLGLSVKDSGQLDSVAWGSPAFKAGLTVGDSLVAVNGEAFTAKLLTEAIIAAKSSQAPIALLIKNGSRYRIVPLDYRDGPRFPTLERIDGTPARLDAILKSRS